MSAGMVILCLVLALVVVAGLAGILYEQRNQAEDNADRLAVDNIDLRDELTQTKAALATHVGHPSVGMRPLAPVIDFPRRGGVS